MDKLRRFFSTVPMKLYLILAAVVIFAFFSNDFGLVDIQKTAVILAAGVDRAEDGFRLTAQIAVPKGSDRTTGGTSSVEVEAEGETVSDCISHIYSETGWVPKLVFCDLIVLGEEAAQQNVTDCLDFFLRNEYMPDSCLIAVCEGTAQALLQSDSAIDDVSSLAIKNLFSSAAEKSGNVVKNTLREFAVGHYGASESGYMPYIRMRPQESAQAQQTEQAQSGETEQSSVVYNAEETALFAGGKMVALLPREQTFAFSLLKGNVFSGTFPVEEGEKTVNLSVLKDRGGVSLTRSPVPAAKIGVSLTVRLYDRGVPSPVELIADEQISEQLRLNAETVIRTYVEGLWDACRQSGCDLFFLRRSLYRSSPARYREWKDYIPADIETELSVRVQSVR